MIIKSLFYNFFPKFIISKIINKKLDYFGFLIHLGEISDIKKRYFFSRILPNKILSLLIKFLPPLIIGKINGKNDLKNSVNGYIILCPITAKEMLDNRGLAIEKVNRALKLSEKIGLKIVGLGAYTSSVTNGGESVINKYKLAITNGNAYTSAVIVKDVDRVIKKILNNSYDNLIIAIVGATGSIGSAVSKLIAKNGLKKLILVGRNIDNLKKLESDINILSNQNSNLYLSTEIQDIKIADIIIVTTSASGAIIKSKFIKDNAIIYDITQPKNVDKSICKKRQDILIFNGGLVKTKNIDYKFNFYLPKEIIFACLAETIILTINEMFFDFSIGHVTLDKIEEVDKLAKKIDFGLPTLTRLTNY
jgi:predicted amino acid dehydrogenase